MWMVLQRDLVFKSTTAPAICHLHEARTRFSRSSRKYQAISLNAPPGNRCGIGALEIVPDDLKRVE
jgi:hypothetical protein